MPERRRAKQTLSFLERLAAHSESVRAKADALPVGAAREAMLQKLEQAERAARITRWLSSGEQEPEPTEY
jgi:hypothetical protein